MGHADCPPRGEGRRARAGRGGIRSPRDARAHLARSGGAVGGVHGLVANATHLRGRLRELPGRGHGLVPDSASRHTRARPGVVFSLDPRSRPRVASIAETGATGATRSVDETRSTARVQGTVRDVPPGRGWRAAARRQVNLGIAHCEPKKIAFALGPVSVASLVFIVSRDGLSRQMARTPSARRSRRSRGREEKVADTRWVRWSAAAGPRADRPSRGGRGGARFDDAERGRRWRASDASRV